MAPDQPYCLSALALLSQLAEDRDKSLFPALLQGVPTGFFQDIVPSGLMSPSDKDALEDDLVICEPNWSGAESDPALLEELLGQEV